MKLDFCAVCGTTNDLHQHHIEPVVYSRINRKAKNKNYDSNKKLKDCTSIEVFAWLFRLGPGPHGLFCNEYSTQRQGLHNRVLASSSHPVIASRAATWQSMGLCQGRNGSLRSSRSQRGARRHNALVQTAQRSIPISRYSIE